MDFSQFILTVNSACIIILLVLALILLAATRFRGENGYAAAIIVIPTIPVYLYNISRMLGWEETALILLPLSTSVNTLLMPLLWLFTRRNFDLSFRFRLSHIIHIAPMLLCLAIVLLGLSVEERLEMIRYEATGDDMWFGDLNTSIVAVQMLLYFPAIFIHILKQRKYIGEYQSDAEWVQKAWILQFMTLFATLFVIVMVCYAIWPRTDAWLIQILNVIAMCWLVYNSIVHPVTPTDYTAEQEDSESKATAATPPIDEEKMQAVCQAAIRYMTESKAYLRYDISLALFAKEINIPQRTLSRSINNCMGCNFFEFVNRMRIEEAKQRLQQLKSLGYSIDGIYAECGFRSRSSFYMVFKKVTGKTPAAWIKDKQ